MVIDITPIDTTWFEKAKHIMDNKIKPLGSLGTLETIACSLSAIQRSLEPMVDRILVVMFAGDHGIVEEGVSLYPQEVTRQMVCNFLSEGAAINVLSRQVGAELLVADIGVKGDFPLRPKLLPLKVREATGNCFKENALSRKEVEEAVQRGLHVAYQYGKEQDILIAGEMGIGNTSYASLVLVALLDIPIEDLVGKGTGVEGEKFFHKQRVLREVFERRTWQKTDPLSLLEAFGGLEIAAMVGCCLGVASRGKVVVVDGFIATAAFLVAISLCPSVSQYAFLGHLSEEKGHCVVVEKMGMQPLLSLGMRLGEGTGAVLSVFLLQAAARLLREMASFEQANVSRDKQKNLFKTLDFFLKCAMI